MTDFYGILDDYNNGINPFILDEGMENKAMNEFNPYNVRRIAGMIVEHKKTGKHYYVKAFVLLNQAGITELAVEYIQSPRRATVTVGELVRSVIEFDYPVHVRPCSEFFDGRFEVLSE